jgi:hypothetical protein
MAERDRFELDLAAALRDYAVDAPIDVRPAELAHHFADAYPLGRRATGRWSFGSPPALAWMLLLAGLLLALMAGGMLAGAWRPDLGLIVAPSPAPVATLVAEGTDILASTKAKPLPAQATCPSGTDPDAPGRADQERPFAPYGAMAFDRHAGRVVVMGSDEETKPRTWTFDVCSNTWQRMHPPVEPPWDDPVKLVYDADSDRTLGFTSDGGVWSYDLSADRWTKQGSHPERQSLLGWTTGAAAVYHDPSGLVIVYDGDSMAAYDAETDTMTQVRQLPDPSRPAGSGMPDGVTAAVYDRDRDRLLAVVAVPDDLRDSTEDAGFFVSKSRPYMSWVQTAALEIWALDPGTGVWRLQTSQVPAGVLWQSDGYFYGPVGRVAYDEASGATVFLSSDGRVEAYDGQRSWRAHPSAGDRWGCDTLDPVYDSINGRIVCQTRSLVAAFSTATGQWRWLLK